MKISKLFLIGALLVAVCMAVPVMAVESPPGANSTQVSLGITPMKGGSPVTKVHVGDVLTFQLELSHAAGSGGVIYVDYQEGTLAAQIAAHPHQHVAGFGDTPTTTIPKVTTASPFVVATPFTYTVLESDIGVDIAAGYIKIEGDYGETTDFTAGNGAINGIYLFEPTLQTATAHVSVPLQVVQPSTLVTIVATPTSVVGSGTVDLTITEHNDGSGPLTAVQVIVNDGSSDIATLNAGNVASGDGGVAGTLESGETWTWNAASVGALNDILVTSDITFTAIGSGLDATGTTITWCEDIGAPPANTICDQDERATADVAVVDARISITPNGTNQVNNAHNFTVTVEKNDGTGWAPAAGVSVTGVISSGPGSITSANPAVTNASGQMTITVNSAVTGTATVNASGTVNVGGVDIAVATNGYGALTVNNQKTWVDARISIGTSGTNPIDTPHNFTVTVEKNDGTGWAPAADVSVTGVISSGPGSITSANPANTNASGQMTITVNSAVTGTATVNASGTVNVSGININVATDGYGAFNISNQKTWVANPCIDIEKATNGEDADNPTGPSIPLGDPVTWTYVVTNCGDVPLTNVVVTDDNGTPGDDTDDFNPTPVDVSPADGYNDGDINTDNVLDLTETWLYEASGTAAAGQYENWACVSGYFNQTEYTDCDPSHYIGQGTEGCTPGFWKNNAQNWDAGAWVYWVPSDTFDDAFGRTITIFTGGNPKNQNNYITDPTLLEALGANGGGINALARHAVAALLNISSGCVNYGMGETELIEAVQQAIDEEDYSLASYLDYLNNAGCPISQHQDGDCVID